MRLYLDQMLSAEMAVLLRGQGHDVTRASEVGQARANDAEILQRATAEGRVLVTLDAHFGDWAVLPLAEHAGVIRLRIQPTSTQNAAEVLVPLLAGRDEAAFRNMLVIASLRNVRWIRTGR